MKNKKSIWLPPLLALSGTAFYIYDGLQMNSWKVNLPNIIIFYIIVCGLFFALRKKEKLQAKHDEENFNK